MKNLLLVFVIFFAVINNVRADFAKGLEAYQQDDYETALQEWTQAAESGDLAAMRNVGHLFRWGKGTTKNTARASYWYLRAAKEGFDKAQYNLALLYLEGEGVPQDDAEAKRWLELASAQGHQEAKKKLSELKDSSREIQSNQEQDKILQQPTPSKKEIKLDVTEKEEKTAKLENKPVVVKKENKSEIVEKNTLKGLVHLSSYNKKETADAGWKQIMKQYVGIERFDSVVKEVDIKGKKMFRLFAKGDREDAIELCKRVRDKKEYCIVYDENDKRIF